MRRAVPLAAAAVVVGAMLAPVVRDRDSYPLSTYPMFATDRARTSSVATVVGMTGDGAVVRLSPQLIGGTDEVVLAVETAARAVRAGPARSLDLCHRVATRVARAGRDDVATVRVGVEVYDAVAWFTEDRRVPDRVTTHAECEVVR